MCKFDPWLTEKTAKVKKSEKIFSTSDFLDFFFFCFFGGFWGKVPAWTPKSERVWVTQCSVTWGDFVVLAEKRAKTRPGAGNFFFFFFFFPAIFSRKSRKFPGIFALPFLGLPAHFKKPWAWNLWFTVPWIERVQGFLKCA